jgi:hypothetical protein
MIHASERGFFVAESTLDAGRDAAVQPVGSGLAGSRRRHLQKLKKPLWAWYI